MIDGAASSGRPGAPGSERSALILVLGRVCRGGQPGRLTLGLRSGQRVELSGGEQVELRSCKWAPLNVINSRRLSHERAPESPGAQLVALRMRCVITGPLRVQFGGGGNAGVELLFSASEESGRE